MFEKSLYDLIRGLRNHKGSEKEYIQFSLRECRNEIRGSDMDLKATALLKLIYLEMFGHDMSWASFNVLEVMSSPKYLQKRVGYLAAVQSFRPDTEVLMLATNLLKKDVSSPSIPTISLPLVTLPHIATSSLALSIMGDLMPRLSHSSPSIRKKTIVTLYRLALAYPEVLRPAWPKIKEMLMDVDEDRSVTAAVVNVVCELGWRRPRDFLPLAPRLFDLLVDGGNNWMAIKIIKLFATLTPLEPRLVKKLLPPLTNLIKKTPAMSLLYECINGIIQGGILEGADGLATGDEIAALCVGKLRGMVAIEDDPNLKYVALLAFNKIVTSHPHLVLAQQDVILDCIDDPDISIRRQALDLSSGMIDGNNLDSIVHRLLRQLRDGQSANNNNRDRTSQNMFSPMEPAADADGEDPEEILHSSRMNRDDVLPMPDEYRHMAIRQILDMCSRNTYANILNFEWYVDILLELAWLVPLENPASDTIIERGQPRLNTSLDTSARIGSELQNVAVRVSDVRTKAVRAADSLIKSYRNRSMSQISGVKSKAVLTSAAWIIGEYAQQLSDRQETLDALLSSPIESDSATLLCAYLQAIPKVLAVIFKGFERTWNVECQTMVSLLVDRVILYLTPLSTNPSLEIQERSVELLELMRLAAEAVKSNESLIEGPLILIEAIPSLFFGSELNPIAATAQVKVPAPDNLDLTIPLNKHLSELLHVPNEMSETDDGYAEIEEFYYHRKESNIGIGTVDNEVINMVRQSSSYQLTEDVSLNSLKAAKDRAVRQDRNKDDPFYISEINSSSGSATPLHGIIQNSNGTDVDIESIPIIDLEIGENPLGTEATAPRPYTIIRKKGQKAHIVAEEDLEMEGSGLGTDVVKVKKLASSLARPQDIVKKSLLEVDSSGIGSLSLDEDGNDRQYGPLDHERQILEDVEIAKALAEVDRLRLEMQRASERVQVADNIPEEGTLVKKKRKKKKAPSNEEPIIAPLNQDNGEAENIGHNMKVGSSDGVEVETRKTKKKKKKKKTEAVKTTEAFPGVKDPD